MDLDGQGKEKEPAMERKIICALCGKSLEMTETFFDYYGHHLHKDLQVLKQILLVLMQQAYDNR